MVQLVRWIGLGVLAVVAVITFVVATPGDVKGVDNSAMITLIEADHDANNARADGAPQQQVVNGWTTHSYLTLLSSQLDEIASTNPPVDHRTPALLLILVLAATLHFATSSTEAAAKT